MATLTIADLDNGKRDLKTVDAVANSQSDMTTTRYGDSVLTLAGALRRLGYAAPIPYASGLTINSGLTTVSRDGVIYAPDPSLVPFTTGAWNPAQWRLVQNTQSTNHQVYQFPTLGAAQAAAATLPDGSAIVVDGQTQGHVNIGAYAVDSGVPAVVFQDYAAMTAYTGKSSIFQIKKPGIAGFFSVIAGDTTSAANGATLFVLADGRRVQRLYQAGSVHFDWWGADNTGLADCAALLESAHAYIYGSTIDKVLQFSAGKYRLNRKVKIRGIGQWQGGLGGAGGTQFLWYGADDAAISFDPQDWSGNYQIVVKDIGVTRGATGSRAAAFEQIRSSEFEFDNVYAKDMACLHRLRGATIMYYNRNVTADCDNVIELMDGSGLFVNSMLEFDQFNFWNTAGSIIKVESGTSEKIYFNNGFMEKFKQFIGNGSNSGTAPNLFECHVSDTPMYATGVSDCRLIYFKSKPGTESSSVLRLTFNRVVAALNSSDHACLYDLNGNTSVGTSLGSDTQFNDCHIYGAVTGLVSSNTPATTVRMAGQTVARQGYYTGSLLVPAHGSAKLIQSNRTVSFVPAFSSTGGEAAVGNGAIAGQYCVETDRVAARISLSFGSTTAQGSGLWEFTLPMIGKGAATGTALVNTPGTAVIPCVLTGDASLGKLQLVRASDGTTLPFAITTNATTTITIDVAYQI